MSQFAIYKYEFVPTGTRGLSHQGTDGASLLNQAHDQLSRSLTTEDFKLYLTKKSGEPMVYPYKVLCTRQGVTVMRVCNVKHVTLVKEKSTRNAWKSPIRGATPSKYAPRCVSRAFFVTRWSLRGGTSGRADRGASCRDARPYRKDATPWR